MSTARYAGLDEDGEYAIYGLSLQGHDITCLWEGGSVLINDHRGHKVMRHTCQSFAAAEEFISRLTGCDFNKEDSYDPAPHWQPVRRERIPRPLERQR